MRTRVSHLFGLLFITVLFLASCSKHTTDANDDDANTQAHGLGSFSRFGGQEAGESYTTKAPHNQTYLFAYDNSSFAPKYRASLEAQAEFLNTHPNARIMLAGHTDERGSREYNIALGERRANSVRTILRGVGVNANQIRVVSYGKERPVYEGHDDSAHRQNRRVELIYEATR